MYRVRVVLGWCGASIGVREVSLEVRFSRVTTAPVLYDGVGGVVTAANALLQGAMLNQLRQKTAHKSVSATISVLDVASRDCVYSVFTDAVVASCWGRGIEVGHRSGVIGIGMVNGLISNDSNSGSGIVVIGSYRKNEVLIWSCVYCKGI